MKNRELVPTVFQTPFTLVRRLSDEMERLFADIGFTQPVGFFAPTAPTFDWVPVIEVYQKEGKLFILAELPGLKKEEVKIQILENLLTLEGERRIEKQEKEQGYVRTERAYGRFFRQIPLPEGTNIEQAKAIFKNGILEIEMPLMVKKPVVGRTLPIVEEPEKELVGV